MTTRLAHRVGFRTIFGGLAAAAIVVSAAFATVSLAAAQPSHNPHTPKRPNVVVVLADDMGFNDVGYNGSEIKTPRVDAWVKDAVRFSHFYSNVVCSPTRAGLMTGRWPLRFGMMRGTVEPGETYGIPASEETLAEALARGGYRHRALIGKWHLGDQKLAYHPLNNGFTYFYGHLTGGLDYFTHEREGVQDLHRNLAPVKGVAGQYITHLEGDEATAFLTARGKDRAPFLLYLAPFAPHQPNQTLPEYVEPNKAITNANRLGHAALVTSFDTLFGRVIDALAANGLADDTLVVFMSDNGGDVDFAGPNVNTPLRGDKGKVFEGGMRVPGAMRWPAGGVAGGKVVDARVGYIDIMPTALAAAGVAPGANSFDGVNLLPVIKRGAAPRRDWFAYIGGRADPKSAAPESLAVIRDGWKLVRQGPSFAQPPAEPRATYQLFKLDEDPNEKSNVAATEPAKVAELREALIAWRALEPDDGVRRRKVDPAWKPFPNWTPPN